MKGSSFPGNPILTGLGLHYNMRSELISRSGIVSFKASRIRAGSPSGRATRRRTNCWPSVVFIKMSPILIAASSRRITCGVIRLGLGDDRGLRRSGLRILVIRPARLARWSSVFQRAYAKTHTITWARVRPL